MAMSTATIQGLRPNVTQQEALGVFLSARPSTWYWRARCGPLQRIAPAYVPYVLYRVSYSMKSSPRTTLFALDVVDGSLDLFTFDNPPAGDPLLQLDTGNRLH